MKLAWFGVEEWLNPMDSLARINLGSSCVSALRMDELFRLTGEDEDAFLEEMRTMSLHYHIRSSHVPHIHLFQILPCRPGKTVKLLHIRSFPVPHTIPREKAGDMKRNRRT